MINFKKPMSENRRIMNIVKFFSGEQKAYIATGFFSMIGFFFPDWKEKTCTEMPIDEATRTSVFFPTWKSPVGVFLA